MTFTLILEQTFNGLQAGVTLFLVAAGLTLILGIMDFVFLAHGSQVMIGAYAAAAITLATGNFYLGVLLAIPVTFASGYLLEYLIIRHLYRRDHMEQVLATFGLILFSMKQSESVLGLQHCFLTCHRHFLALSKFCLQRPIQPIAWG